MDQRTRAAGLGLGDWFAWLLMLTAFVGIAAGLAVFRYRRRQRANGENSYEGIEKRVYPRRRGGSVSVEVADAEGRIRPYRGWVIDRSVGGVCLAVEEEV